MADQNKKSSKLLPEHFRTEKNSKFLSSTIDQLIRTPQLERIDGYVGSLSSPTYDPLRDIYLKEPLPLRKNYPLEPALVFRNKNSDITDVVAYDDIINEIGIQGGENKNLDRLFRTKTYSYDPYIDWDKLLNYSQYYWLPEGPDLILINSPGLDVKTEILGRETYTMPNGYNLSNGMKVTFSDNIISTDYKNKVFLVEGVGSSIVLIDINSLQPYEQIVAIFDERFDSTLFDSYPFDNDKKLPLTPEYITINRASIDFNPWTRYNRWFHESVIKISAEINNTTPKYTVDKRAQRPIIEFRANIQLYNFGKKGIKNVDLIDTETQDAYSRINGSYGFYIDGVLLEQGHRIILNAEIDDDKRNKIYRVEFNLSGDSPVIELVEDQKPKNLDSAPISYGEKNSGTSWYYNSSTRVWQQSQQHTTINQPPLFDLFDDQGNSFSDQLSYRGNFQGNKIFGYDVGTGTSDPVLGFPLKYQNSIGTGSYLFKNYFTSDIITISVDNISSIVPTKTTFFKINNIDNSESFLNVWKNSEVFQIPVIEIKTVQETTNTLTVTCFDRPISLPSAVDVYIKNKKVSSVTSSTTDSIVVNLTSSIATDEVATLKIFTNQVPNENGYYETPLSLTNNPLNGPVTDMTLSELTDHVSSMVDRITDFNGVFPGNSNLRDLSDYSKYGNRLILNENPISFTQIFLGKKEHNVVDSIRSAADHYNQFKMNLLRTIPGISDSLSPIEILDEALKRINSSKGTRSLYYTSDMIGHGNDKVVVEFTIEDLTINEYPIGIDFNLLSLSRKSVLIYINGTQLVVGRDFNFNKNNSSIIFTDSMMSSIAIGDAMSVVRYNSTLGSFIPPTPSTMGLYPAFYPEIYNDDSYVEGVVELIQGHDGSVMRAYGDYRDKVILEFEKRVFNNIKAKYNSDVFDIISVVPGAFRDNGYTFNDFNKIITKDFIRWAGIFNINVTVNDSFNEDDPFTWNYKNSIDSLLGTTVSGSWRALFKFFYDTDSPNTTPWKMLGFANMPSWWEDFYGFAPYTSNNTALWSDLELGYIAGEHRYNGKYARPGLTNIIPVDTAGALLSPDQFLVGPVAYTDQYSSWIFGDQGPAETTWRKSSYWPFILNAASALLDPCKYISRLYDVSRILINSINQISYADTGIYLNPADLLIPNDTDIQIAGFGVYVQERGNQNNLNYSSLLEQDLSYLNFNLFHKLGGFSSKEKLQVIIDSTDPTSFGSGATLPPEDYSLILNVSNPIRSSRISGIIVQKNNGKFLIKGYDRVNPYFEIFKPIKTTASGSITVGGVSASFTEWSNSLNSDRSSTPMSSTAATTTRYYKQGQIVRYNGKFYKVKVGHNLQPTFDPALFQLLPSLPIKGGTTVQLPVRFENTVTQIPYGSELTTSQEVYDLIIGYGEWLKKQGFIFDQYNESLSEILDWKFTGKEFLYWTTQNWAENNLITLSPFAEYLKFSYADSVVDSVISKNYEYSLLKADGKPFPIDKFNILREDGVCVITTPDTEEGLFFAVLNSVQKEHAMVFNNTTMFNDTMYDIESGYRQKRIRLSGFRTKNWDGDFFSPGFVYDTVSYNNWEKFAHYLPGNVVRYNGSYYQANKEIVGDETFDFNKWVKLPVEPTPQLLPNFDYKISQFEDFYSLDIDNFDYEQQKLAQHLTGYTERNYLKNIFTTPIAQYKFYQGFIKQKGTKTAIEKLAKVNKYNKQGEIEINESWAFRVGNYGSFESYRELEFGLEEGSFLENPYIVKFVDQKPKNPNSLINYVETSNLLIKPDRYLTTATFKTTESNFFDTGLELVTAGYVRQDDVTVTAYNKNSILDIASNSLLKEGDTIWTGFLENGDWTVYRYTLQVAKITGVILSIPGEEITFVTNYHHKLSEGDIVSVVRFNDQVNGIYRVTKIIAPNQFSVSASLSNILDENLPYYGALFKFEKSRYSNIDEFSRVKNLFKLFDGEKIWIDEGLDGKWQVFQKVKNYSSALEFSPTSKPAGQKLGFEIFSTDDSPILLTSAYAWYTTGGPSYGKVWVYNKVGTSIEKQYEYTLNSAIKQYCDPSTSTQFGYSLSYDIGKKLYFAGAPEASLIRAPSVTGVVVLSTGSGATKSFVSEGIVKVSSRDIRNNQELVEAVLVSPYATTGYTANYARFGHSIYNNQVSSNQSTLLLVGSPGGYYYSDTGSVYAYQVNTSTNTSTVTISAHPSGIRVNSTSSITLSSGARWGHKISGDNFGNVIAISAPNHYNSTFTGLVQIFDKNLHWKQTLISPFGTDDPFGNDVVVSSSGKYLMISSTEARKAEEPKGKVAIYVNTSNQYVLSQIIENPLTNSDLKLGHSISISDNETTLAISALGTNRARFLTFDSNNKSKETTFDQATTRFVDPIPDSGAVYLYTKLGEFFVQTEELSDANISQGSRYGTSVVIANNNIFVGSPSSVPIGIRALRLSSTSSVVVPFTATISVSISSPDLLPGVIPTVEIVYSEVTEATKTISGVTVLSPGSGYVDTPTATLIDQYDTVLNNLTVILETDNSKFYQFKKIDSNSESWKVLRSQEELVDPSTVKRVALIDSKNDEIVDYLDVIDPLKGKVAGIADRELTYRSVYDPAVYSIGVSGTTVDTTTSWIDEHVGELWWDLSTAKYIWYEQGDEVYKKNNWGKLFPGATIDVYEWVKSDILPSEWANRADTSYGLTNGISGQPKYPDNSIISVKQVYNNVTGAFENVYYFWVKNKVTVPNNPNRKISSYQVSRIIADPAAEGLKFAEIISSDAVAFANIQPTLIGNTINANIVVDNINTDIPRHTEWILLEEGDVNSLPNSLLEKKLIDSLLGRDQLGNLVPSPLLTPRNKYGIGIRPQQTLFKNRLEVLRNLIEFANSVFIKNRMRGNYDFANLESQEKIPDETSREYDLIVEDLESLNQISTTGIKQAELQCFVNNGKIQSVSIVNPGSGYSLPPKVNISSNSSGAEILVEIDELGKVSNAIVKNSGSQFISAPILEVRPHSVIVLADPTSSNKWSKYVYTYSVDQWAKIKTQSFNTPLYWKYVDWKSEDFNPYKDFDLVASDVSQLPFSNDVAVGSYIKIKNIGDGRYIILSRVADSGNYSTGYDIVYSELGTIQILDTIWNYPNTNYSYDSATLDETWYDQTPDLELYRILQAIKNDLFVNGLKINWNRFFFKAVKAALVEQKLLDWAFKTSFINIVNKIGTLDQRPVYKFDNDRYIEDYINEIKPYHTKIRNFISSYNYPINGQGDPSYIYTTDFDLPPYYNSVNQAVEVVNLGDDLLDQQPWKDWADNHKYQLGSVLIANPGKGYTQKPSVVITTAPGDSGTGASADAYIKDGKLYKVVVTNPGSGYVTPPVLTITNGGPYVTTTATVSPVMSNTEIRKNIIGFKFDRVGVNNEIGTVRTEDVFVCPGDRDRFTLTWLAEPDKSTITPTLDGKLILATEYTIEYYTEKYNGYSKKFSKFVFLNIVPENGQVLKIKYNKHVDLYTAVDRIDRFYSPTEVMPGKELPLLMTGAEYPQQIIQGLPISYSVPWSSGVPYDTTPWDDLIDYYTTAKLVSTATVRSTTLSLDTTTGLVPGQIINILNSSTIRLRTDTAILSINSSTGVIALDCPTYGIKYAKAASTSTGTTVTFKTRTDFLGDIKIGDLVFVSGMTTLGYNGQYTISGINNNDVFEVITTGTVSSIYGEASSTATVRVAAVLGTIPANNELLGHFWSTVTNVGSVLIRTFSKLSDVSRVSVKINNTSTSSYSLIEDYEISGRAAVQVPIIYTSSATTVTVDLFGNPTVEFWKFDSNVSSLDSLISGGTWTGTNFAGGLGVSPEDLIIRGDSFLSANDGYAPEESVPGHVLDTLSVEVYTQQSATKTLMITGAFSVEAGVTSTFVISEVTEAVGGFMLHIGGRILDATKGEYFIEGNVIRIPAQSYTGRGGYTIVNVGADRGVDGNAVFVQNQTEALVESLSYIGDIRSAYVLVDGQEINQISTTTDYGYMLSNVSSENNRACVRVYNMPQGNHTIEAWFFRSIHTKFNRISEERFSVTDPQTVFSLSKQPGILEPLSVQAIVEVDDNAGRRRLSPPWVSYYKLDGIELTYKIDSKHDRPSGTYGEGNVRAFANGYTLRSGFDYTVDSVNSTITLTSGILEAGDVLAIEGLVDYEYVILGNILTLGAAVDNAEIKVISFTDHDNMMLRTDRFAGVLTRKFVLSRDVMNDNYIWASVNGRPLIARYDFKILNDKRTVELSEWIDFQVGDEILISTINTSEFGGKILGFRVFKDLFDKNHYIRLSKYHSTVLAKDLLHSDTEIFVQDATELVPANPARNIPGVVFIDSERIEFFSKEGNVLRQLRRSTLGTAPAHVSLAGTRVIDQSLQQYIPYTEDTLVQRFYTTETNTYVINTVTSTSTGDGIVISPGIAAKDQITVYYGGRQLRKDLLEVHNKNIAYDTTSSSIITLPPEFSINTSTQELILNISEFITSGTQVTIVKKVGYVWTGTESLITSGVRQAQFLRSKEAELPNIYYYGGE
jgi:hypothetical protein